MSIYVHSSERKMAGLSASCAAIIFAIFFTFLALPALGASNFLRIPLGKGSSIEVPRNWIVLSGNQRITLDTFVEAKGFRQTESTLSFAANLYDEQGHSIAIVNSRIYPDNPLTQAHARQLNVSDLKEFDEQVKRSIEAPLSAIGVRMTNWYGSRMQMINGLQVLVHEHQQTSLSDGGVIRVRGLRVWNSPRSFTVTIGYHERGSLTLLPIVDYMTKSLRQD